MQKYHVITGSTPEELDREVEKYLNDGTGWFLQGGVSVTGERALMPIQDGYEIVDEFFYAQAVWRMDSPAKVDALKEPAEAVA